MISVAQLPKRTIAIVGQTDTNQVQALLDDFNEGL